MNDSKVNSFMDIRSATVAKMLEAKKEGVKVVGIYCTFCPQELVIAAGAVPVGLCGTKEDPVTAAEEVLPRNLCPLIKSSYGFAATNTCPFFVFSDLVVGETTCDGKKKMFEIMQELKPVHVMQLPHMSREGAALDLWVDEVRRLKSRLEEEFGVEITDEKIREAMDLVNKEKSLQKEISDFNRVSPPLLSGMDLLTVIWSSGFGFDKMEVIEMLAGLKDTLSSHKSLHGKPPGPRILLTGCPVGIGSEKVIRVTEELGASVVAMENCTGYKTLGLMSDTTLDDPIVALAKKYIQIPCSCMSPNRYRMNLISGMIDDFSVHGVIDLTWQACHTYNVESYEVGRLVKQKNLPYLHLETDYSSSDLESLKVRIQSMLEMIDGNESSGYRPGVRCC